MKKIGVIILSLITILYFSSCQKEFLSKKLGTDINQDSIFSTRQKSLAAIAQAYSMSLVSGIVTNGWDDRRVNGMRGGYISSLSDEIAAIKFNWNDGWIIARSGLTANDGSGIPRSTDGFAFNYAAIRQNYLVISNIDKVADVSQEEKNRIKAEMKVLTAYRYEEMLKKYGGVPIVDSVLDLTMDVMKPRATVQQTLDHIEKLCDEAIPVLPARYDDANVGRVTSGVAMAIKAEALITAARPLFNSATPYMDLGSNNNLISFGNADNKRWQNAVDANLAVINWASTNGYEIINTGSPFDDYGNAVSTPNNKEVLIAYKTQYSAGLNLYDPHTQGGGANAMSFKQLSYYYKADGSEQTWTNETTRPYSEYITKVNQMEPRFKASAMVGGQDAWNNPGDQRWSTQVLSYSSDWDGRGGTEGAGRRVKFWYKAGQRNWFEFPIYRLAESYLNLAEAYNELGNATESQKYLNVIRKRAGLPNITESDQTKLRNIIQREWAIEFYEENHRYYDLKHWKHPDIANGLIGGPKKAVIFTYVNGTYGVVPADYITYSVRTAFNGFWAPNQYLEPFPGAEINKGYIVQNPGY